MMPYGYSSGTLKVRTAPGGFSPLTMEVRGSNPWQIAGMVAGAVSQGYVPVAIRIGSAVYYLPVSGVAPGSIPGTAPGRAPGTAPGRATGAAPGRASGTAPARAPGTATGRATGASTGRATGTAPGRAPAPGAAPDRPKGLTAKAAPFVPQRFQKVPKDDKHKDELIRTLKRAAAWDLRILAGLTTQTLGLDGEICFAYDLDEGLPEAEQKRRAAIRQRMFASDPRFTASTATVATVLGLARRIYHVQTEEDVLAISDEFITLCTGLGIPENEIERFVVNLANLREELALAEVTQSVLDASGI